MTDETARPAPAKPASLSAGTSLRSLHETGGFDASPARSLHARLRVAATLLACAGGGVSARRP